MTLIYSQFRKAAFVLNFVVPLVLGGCRKEHNDPPPPPNINQTVVVVEDVNIQYSARIFNVDHAQLTVNRDNILVLTEKVDDINAISADYEKTFNYTDNGIIKGDYEFILRSGDLEKRTSVKIPDLPVTVGLKSGDLDLKKYSKQIIPLPAPKDGNPEDNPVTYTGAKSLDGVFR
jgi:hypothetical protein